MVAAFLLTALTPVSPPRADAAALKPVSPMGSPPTPFRLVEQGPSRVVFENLAHDFPQRILYWLDEAGALHARVEGTEKGIARHEEWRWRRAASLGDAADNSAK
jgi:hypothetical protein